MSTRSFVDAIAITPSDTASNQFDAIYVGTSSSADLAIKPSTGGANVTFVDVLPGTVYHIQTDLVLDTGTTASDLVGLRY